MKHTFFLVVFVLVTLVFIRGALLRSASHNTIFQQLDTRPTSSIEALEAEPDLGLVSEYGPLTKTYKDADQGFLLQYPASFMEVNLPEWESSIVDNDTKARIWIGFCSTDCTHLIRFPFSGSDESYTQDSTITWEDSPEIPLGEGRRIHILSNREFTTEHGTHAIEQFYETTGFNVATGEPATLYCAEDTPCESSKPALRYIFFSEGKAPYVTAVRAPLYLIRSIVKTASY
jgi:hypothetical protein